MKEFLTLHYAVIKIDFSKKSIKIVNIESNFFVDRSGWLMAQNNRKMIGLKCKEVDFSIFSENQKSKYLGILKIEKYTWRGSSPAILRFFEPSSNLISRKKMIQRRNSFFSIFLKKLIFLWSHNVTFKPSRTRLRDSIDT